MVDFFSTLVAPLNHTLFVLGQDHVTWAELLGFLTGIWCVWLTVKSKIWNFPVGLANDVFFFVLFIAARLYADAGLQIIYFILGVIGWYAWLHDGGKPIRQTTRAQRSELIVLGFIVVVATAILTRVLSASHDVAPFLDALTTALSLAAQWLLNFKKIQNWMFWIAADLIYIPLYASKHLWLTAVVYVVFLGLCVGGWKSWTHDLHDDELAKIDFGSAPR